MWNIVDNVYTIYKRSDFHSLLVLESVSVKKFKFPIDRKIMKRKG